MSLIYQLGVGHCGQQFSEYRPVVDFCAGIYNLQKETSLMKNKRYPFLGYMVSTKNIVRIYACLESSSIRFSSNIHDLTSYRQELHPIDQALYPISYYTTDAYPPRYKLHYCMLRIMLVGCSLCGPQALRLCRATDSFLSTTCIASFRFHER